MPCAIPGEDAAPDRAGAEAREPRVLEALLALTDTSSHPTGGGATMTTTLLAQCCTELIGVSAATVILVEGDDGGLSLSAASSARSRLLLEFALAIGAGPGVECARTGESVVSGDLTGELARRRWARFATGAAATGFRSEHALPMRRRGQVIGAVSLLRRDPRPLAGPDVRLAQGLADAAAVGLLHERAVRAAETESTQLQGALTSRVPIEQAKGVLTARADLTLDEAFVLLRTHARRHGLTLSELARGVVDGTVDLTGTRRPAGDADPSSGAGAAGTADGRAR